tara:strand:+ start:1300 stop:1956 length:657 start_codon:yes stop_codon:yes gene_type:complete
MNIDERKQAAAVAALDYIEPGMTVGVGTGSTANYFIDALAGIKQRIDTTVASSEASAARLRSHGISVHDLNAVDEVAVYVDGTDETTLRRELIKGGGGALTREKIVASVARKFVCIADDSKLVKVLGEFPLPVEVIPMARSLVARTLSALGGTPRWRQDFVTDNGNHILDVANLQILEPSKLEADINQIAGVVTNGLFARRGADVLLLGRKTGIERIE